MLNAEFSVTTNTGFVHATDFTFVDQTTSTSSIVNRSWDFGDGTFLYNTLSYTKNYNYPGVYTVSLTATNLVGETGTYTTQVSTDYFLRDKIEFESLPSHYADPGKTTENVFRIKLQTAQIDKPVNVILFAANSPSTPYQFVPEHWRFLTPTWRFTDKNLNFITSLSVETSPVYFNNRVVGLTGIGEFYYIDDLTTGNPEDNCPVIITATLETSGFNYPQDSNVHSYPSYANNENTLVATTWLVNDLRPNVLKITENYLSDIFPLKWKNVKVPFIVTCHNRRNGVDSNILFSYPESNFYGSISSISVSLSNTNGIIVDEAPLYFKATDNNNSKTGGFIFTTLTPTSAIDTTVIQASTVAFFTPVTTSNTFIYPTGEATNPTVWISNPNNSDIIKIFLQVYPNNCNIINSYKDKNLFLEGYTSTVENVLNYGLVFDPDNKELYTADSYRNILYKFSSNGSLLSSLTLSTINTSFSSASAANIALDKNFNVYLTFFNSTSVLKLDKNFNLLTSFTYPSAYSYKPPVVETDKESGVWLAYSSALSTSTLQRYSSANTQLLNISLNLSSVPVSLAATQENNVWVANSYNQLLSGGTLQQFNTTGTLVSTISSFTHPTSLAMDRSNGVWFTHGTRNLGYITPQGTAYSWLVSAEGTTPSFSSIAVSTLTQTTAVYIEKELGGLAVDVYNRVWVIDSLKGKAYTFTATTTINNSAIQVVNLDNEVNSITNEYFKPIQSYGDWTGNKWYQKYYKPESVSAISLQGTSAPFKIKEFTNPAQIYRINENFDTAGYYKSLALPEILNQNNKLFDTFLGAALGNGVLSSYEDLGQKTYECIANFVYNTADTDTCNIDHLISFAQETATPFLNYGLIPPADIKKYLDISSIPKLKLWGIQSPIPLSGQSVGEQLNTTTALVTAGSKIYTLNKFNNQYTLYTVPLLSANSTVPLSAQSVYPLSSMNGVDLVPPFINNYLFFEYKPVFSSNFVENIIDWSNPNTTLTPYASSVNDWYGEMGGIENAFNYLLTKNIISK